MTIGERTSFAPSAAPETKEYKPILAIDTADILYPTQFDNLVGVVLGMRITLDNAGLICKWSIIVRRGGDTLCQIDYDDELTCEEEQETLRKEIDAWLTGGYPFEMFTKAIGITNFNPETNRPL